MSRDLIIIFMIASSMALVSCATSRSAARNDGSRETQVVMNATDLGLRFELTETLALELYGGKRARIKGQFAKLEPLPDGNFAVTFKTSRETFRPIRCVVAGVNSTALNKLSDGDDLTVTGTIAGFTESRYFVTVEDCVVDGS